MIVICVLLALWIGIVWWQDKRTLKIYGAQQNLGSRDLKIDEETEVVSPPEHKTS